MKFWIEPNYEVIQVGEFEYTTLYDEIPLTTLWMEYQEPLILTGQRRSDDR